MDILYDKWYTQNQYLERPHDVVNIPISNYAYYTNVVTTYAQNGIYIMLSSNALTGAPDTLNFEIRLDFYDP